MKIPNTSGRRGGISRNAATAATTVAAIRRDIKNVLKGSPMEMRKELLRMVFTLSLNLLK